MVIGHWDNDDHYDDNDDDDDDGADDDNNGSDVKYVLNGTLGEASCRNFSS